jgi:hypothetical protein
MSSDDRQSAAPAAVTAEPAAAAATPGPAIDVLALVDTTPPALVRLGGGSGLGQASVLVSQLELRHQVGHRGHVSPARRCAEGSASYERAPNTEGLTP